MKNKKEDIVNEIKDDVKEIGLNMKLRTSKDAPTKILISAISSLIDKVDMVNENIKRTNELLRKE